MSIKVLSASAGSGKTFNISMFYIHKVLQNTQNFEKILALTFTNAAVNEMKNRILNKLLALSKGDSKIIEEYNSFCSAENIHQPFNDEQLKTKADSALQAIVYRYYNFSIYTIDSFFQKVLSNCLVELGFRTNNKLIVEIDNVVEEVTEEFLFNQEVEQTVLKWIENFVLHKLSLQQNININNELIKLVKEINKEFFFFYKEYFEHEELNVYDKIINELRNKQNKFVQEVNKISSDFVELCNKYQLQYEDFKNGKNGIGNLLYEKFKNFKKGKKIGEIKTKTLHNFIEDGEWFSKSSKVNNKYFEDDLNDLYVKIKDLFKRDSEIYETARIIEDNIYNIGLIHKMVKLFNEYKKENSIIFLSDVAQLLIDFIRENYLFIYEKFGVKYEYFLIDEFQDTSRLQYHVLKPLIEESVSQKIAETSTLIVGDVKQAIYRWRNGDWELMSKKIQEDFPQLNKHSLQYNWRSCPNIINFNNLIIESLIQSTDIQKIIESNFNDFLQKFPENKDKRENYGYVKIVLEKQNKENDDTDSGKWIIAEINKLIQKNYKQIGLLVRSNVEARKVFNLLVQSEDFNNKLPIVSKESITYSNSLVVEWIMYQLHYFYTQSSLSLYVANQYLKRITNKEEKEIISFNNEVTGCINEKQPLSLYLMLEFLLKKLFEYTNISETEKIFVLNFLQKLSNYLIQNDNNEIAFVDWYFKEFRNKTIVLTSKSEGIFIETIHSSKGLEYDAVIIPYVNWPKKVYQTEYLWIKNNKSEMLSQELPLLLLVSHKSLTESFFKYDYELSKNKNKIDDLNLLYVALTRAKKALIFKVYKSGIGENLIEILNNDDFLSKTIEVDGKNITIGSCKIDETTFEIGTLQELQYPIIQEDKELLKWNKEPMFRNLLVVKKNEEFSTSKKIAYGNLLHTILERIDDIDKWEKIAEKVLYEWNVTNSDSCKIKELLKQALMEDSKLYQWYKNAEQIISEHSIISKGKKYRPDKVFIFKNKVVVVDFKTGETDIYNYYPQIKHYRNILEQMGHKNVEAYIYNINKNEIEKL